MPNPPALFRPICRAFAATALLMAAVAAQAGGATTIERLWSYAHAGEQKSEIVAYDRRTDTLWVAGTVGVEVLHRKSGMPIGVIPVGNFGAVNSVAIHDGLAALAIESTQDRTLPGVVVFYDTRSLRQVGQPVAVGALPDMLTFTPDGRSVLVANEGTPNPRPTRAGLSDADPQGSVSIIDVRSRRVTTLPIDASIPGYDTLRLFPSAGTLPTQPATYSPYDPEPEYIAVDKEGRYAYVGLQEANGIAVLDLRKRRFEKIYHLGLKDFSLPGNEIDPNDQDATIALRSVPVKGLYQPDTLASYEHRGRTYLVMANEGDARDNGEEDSEDERRGSAGSSDIEYVPSTSDLTRLNFSNIDSARGGPLVKFGGHSFSIRDTAGRIVYDSGSILDREAIRLGVYDDGRSDNKGVEPEGLALLHVRGRVLAFVGLERSPEPEPPAAPKAAFAVFDITDPHRVEYIDMIVSEGDQSPEGLTTFKVRGRYYLAVAHEGSDTTSLFEIKVQRGRHDRDHDDEDDEDDDR